MKTAINNKFHMKSVQRSDIFRKFQKPFRYLLRDSMHYEKDLYVDQSSTRYEEEFDAFTTSYSSDVRYFIGYTGCGKSTFIRHYFDLDNISPKKFRNDTLVIPSFWNGKKIGKENYEGNIIKHVIGSARSAIVEIDKAKGLAFPYNDLREFFTYIQETRGDILSTLSAEEYYQFGNDQDAIISRILSRTEQNCPIEYTSSSLKYFIEKYSEIKRVVFIIDDVETMDAAAINFLIDTYYHIYDCFQNAKDKEIVVNLLISLRPHSFRFLRDSGFPHEKIIAYGNHLESRCYQIIRNDIPNIREIFIRRFEKAEKNYIPGNPGTWNTAKGYLFSLIGAFENRYVDIITDLCHMNIRAIFDCIQLILSNRIWCQESKIPTEYPDVKIHEYNFNSIVNVLRTLACGENSVYTGNMNLQFNASDLEDMQQRPAFDGSNVFIPNILTNLNNRECDVTTIYIMFYLENKFSSTNKTPANSEFITVSDLLDELMRLLNRTDRDYLENVIQYLFQNRIIRKSIKDHDNQATINQLRPDTYIYFTKKGSRMLKLLCEDSILLEIFREDIVREYSDDVVCRSSFELVLDQRRDILFRDLIMLAREIYYAEDKAIVNALNSNHAHFPNSFIGTYRLSEDICQGLWNTFEYAQNLVSIDEIKSELKELMKEIEKRKGELCNTKQSLLSVT